MRAAERPEALLSAFPEDKELTPAQIAACAPFAREHVVHLCIADPLPIQVRLLGNEVVLRREDLAKFFDQDIADVQVAHAVVSITQRGRSVSRRDVINRLFRSELRFALFSAESLQAFSKLVDSIEKAGLPEDSASPVDERCREYFDMERLILSAEAKSMNVGLHGLVLDTAASAGALPARRNAEELLS